MSDQLMEEYIEHECAAHTYQIEDYEAGVPRWCKGCGDHAILSTFQRILRDDQIDPESVVCVSGIGCSSRFPHYLGTYGFHGIHGRALPIATGVKLSRPDLHVITVMGDGDCFSIGCAHWIHALRYNVDMTVLLFDNEIYALTKKQASPTSRHGAHSNTTPKGAYLEALNPLSVMTGISNLSFLAQTATWLPTHLQDTIDKAWNHKGLSFVRILQYCPVFTPKVYGDKGFGYPLNILENPDGIPVDLVRKMGNVIPHDHTSKEAAHSVSLNMDQPPLGLIYQNKDIPTYEDIRYNRMSKANDKERINLLHKLLDKYSIK